MEKNYSQEGFIRLLEERLLQSDARRSAEVTELLSDDFVEFGSSGRIFTREQIIVALQNERPSQISIADFRIKSLSPEITLVTYRAIKNTSPDQQSVSSLHSSLWQRIEGRWQMVFHQGTLLREKVK